MSELTDKEKAFSSSDVISECIGMTKLQAMEHYFYKAWDIQQSKIDELVKALDRIDFISHTKDEIRLHRIFDIAHEALKKYRGEK